MYRIQIFINSQLILRTKQVLDKLLGDKHSSSGSDGKESAFNAGDLGSIPALGRSPGERIG